MTAGGKREGAKIKLQSKRPCGRQCGVRRVGKRSSFLKPSSVKESTDDFHELGSPTAVLEEEKGEERRIRRRRRRGKVSGMRKGSVTG